MRLFVFAALLIAAGPAQAWTDTQRCAKLWENVGSAYQELYQSLPNTARKDSDRPAAKLARLEAAKCDDAHAEETTKLIENAASFHSGRIGVLLPMGQSRGKAVLQGLAKRFPSLGASFAERVRVADSGGNPQQLQKALAELVFKEEVGVIIGGLGKIDAQALAPWATRLRIPIMLLAPPEHVPNIKSKYLFHVFPNEVAMADVLARYVKKRGFRRLGIVRPAQSDAAVLTHLLSEKLRRSGVDVSSQFVYMAFDFKSMEDAARKLFKIDRKLREKEYAELYEKAKIEAEKAKVAFDPEQIVLPPIIDVDAVFLPDNFKMVRHMIRIFQFHGVKSLPLLGTQEWRARELVEPPESFFRDAVFVDYLGSLKALPGALAKVGAVSEFPNPAEANILDYQVMAYRAAMIADAALQNPATKRFALSSKLQKLHLPSPGLFPAGRVFTKANRTIWPASLFRVNEQGINLF